MAWYGRWHGIVIHAIAYLVQLAPLLGNGIA
jgi:hypothetical protein